MRGFRRASFVVHRYDRGDPPGPWWTTALMYVRWWFIHWFVGWPIAQWWRVRYGAPRVLLRWRTDRALAKAKKLLKGKERC